MLYQVCACVYVRVRLCMCCVWAKKLVMCEPKPRINLNDLDVVDASSDENEFENE